MREPSFGCQWIMWYGDYQLSEVNIAPVISELYENKNLVDRSRYNSIDADQYAIRSDNQDTFRIQFSLRDRFIINSL